MYKFGNVTEIEIEHTPNQTIFNPIRQFGERIFNISQNYFELMKMAENVNESRKIPSKIKKESRQYSRF